MRLVIVHAAVGLCFLLAGCMASPPERPAYYQDLDRADAKVDTGSAAAMISQYRNNNGLGAVAPDPQLSALARRQAKAMAAAGSVKASLAKGNRLQDLMASVQGSGLAASNNVSAGYRTLAKAFSGWRDSPKHRAVMLDPKAVRFGLATAYAPNAKHKVFWSLIMVGAQTAPTPVAKKAGG